MQRVLQVNLEDSGGAFALMFQVQKHLQKEILFDYFTMASFKNSEVVREIKKMGGNIYCNNLRRNRLFGHLRLPFVFYQFLKKGQYHIIHIHSDTAWKICLYAIPAKLSGIKKIVIHSHSSGINGDHRMLKRLMHQVMKPVLPYVGTDYCTCSKMASDWMFGHKTRISSVWVKNGVDTETFKFCEKMRKEIRNQLGVSRQIILIGTVGDLSYQKNPEFLLDVLKKLKETDDKYKLLFIGTGKNEAAVRLQVEKLALSDDVIFYGKTDKVNEVLNALDIYVMTSRFEGLPVSAVEAQANGVPCLLSSEITNEVGLGECRFRSLFADVSVWAEDIHDLSVLTINREKGKTVVQANGFDIQQTAAQIKKIYLG